MKILLKFITLIGMLFLTVGLFASDKQEGAMKKLVVYYSYSGLTEAAGNALAQEIGAETLKLEDVESPSKFKAYISGCWAARKGKAWPIKPVNVDLKNYDKIFVGAPIWWGKCAPEINAFIDQTDFTGKEVVVFVTMGGSNPDDALSALASRIEKKNGKVISRFSIKTGGLKKEAVTEKAKEVSKQYK